MKKVLLSGIKCTGSQHLGNYFGMILNALDSANQDNNTSFFFLADMHSLTIPWNPSELREDALEVISVYLASGFNLERTFFFIQSQNFDHAYLTWIFNCLTSVGRMSEMIEFKEKMKKLESSNNGGENFASMGLMDYPVLMASDILLYQPDEVPVGEDQRQHVELARDIATKFNIQFGETFKLPNLVTPKLGKRIKSLQHPEKKMSKSDRDENGCIFLLDEPDKAARKVMKAVTDSIGVVEYLPENIERAGITNLIEIYSGLSHLSISEVEKKYKGVGYGTFKKDLADIIRTFLETFQSEYNKVYNDKGFIESELKRGLNKAKERTGSLLTEIRKKVGFII